ncbi:hypothetical protein J4212_03670 [Candidatus Woesearchaeota archaeon]|nr:hypothetical protein [Candidatus Woesearchaeota archaeon]
MKHTLKITLMLVFFFMIAQLIGLAITNKYIDHKAIEERGRIEFKDLPLSFERPQIETESDYRNAMFGIIIAVIIGTALLLALIKFRQFNLWKVWYFLAIAFALTFAFAAYIQQYIALAIAIALTLAKIFRPNTFLQNITEIFIYGGLAAILVPMLNILYVSILLVAISVYDFIAVFKTKHMVTLAKFQTQSRLFAGLMLPYKRPEKGTEIRMKPLREGENTKQENKIAVLGGGDIGFPLIFAGVVMKSLMLSNTEIMGFLITLLIPLFAAIALFFLLAKGQKDKFYPAMPLISIGCFIGYGVILLLF